MTFCFSSFCPLQEISSNYLNQMFFSAKMHMGFGKLFVLDSSNATIDVFKAMPGLDDNDTAELFRFPTPFVLLVINNFRLFNFLHFQQMLSITNYYNYLIEARHIKML
jgi:hypothetical protein